MNWREKALEKLERERSTAGAAGDSARGLPEAVVGVGA